MKAGGITFHWEPRRSVNLALPLFILLSMAVHAACFYLFQVNAPSAVTLLPPPVRISLLAPRSAEDRALLGIIELHDPALLLHSTRQSGPELAAPYQPSYASAEPVPKSLPPPSERLPLPAVCPPEPVAVAHEDASASPPHTAPAAIATRISFNGELSRRELIETRALDFKVAAAEPLSQAIYLVGVSATGDVRYVLLERSSGDAGADEKTVGTISRHRFATAAQMGWGRATVDWGNDVYGAAKE